MSSTTSLQVFTELFIFLNKNSMRINRRSISFPQVFLCGGFLYFFFIFLFFLSVSLSLSLSSIFITSSFHGWLPICLPSFFLFDFFFLGLYRIRFGTFLFLFFSFFFVFFSRLFLRPGRPRLITRRLFLASDWLLTESSVANSQLDPLPFFVLAWFGFFLVSAPFYRVLLSFTGFDLVLMGFTRLYLVLLGFCCVWLSFVIYFSWTTPSLLLFWDIIWIYQA